MFDEKGKCPDSSYSRLKRHFSTKWIKNYDAAFVFRVFYPAIVLLLSGSLDQLSESTDGEVLEKAMPYLKAIITAGFLVSLEVINATLKLTKTVEKKLQGIKKLFFCIRYYKNYQLQTCKQSFRNNEEIFVGIFRHAEGVYGESIPMPRIVNRLTSRTNPLIV